MFPNKKIIAISMFLGALICSSTAYAQDGMLGKGHTWNYGIERNAGCKTSPVGESYVQAKWFLRTLMGEPVVEARFRLKEYSDCDLHYNTNLWLRVGDGNISGIIRVNGAIPSENGQWSYDTPGSPNWDKLFYEMDYTGAAKDEFLSGADAKELWNSPDAEVLSIALARPDCDWDEYADEC